MGTGVYNQNDVDITAGAGDITITADDLALTDNTDNNALTDGYGYHKNCY
ncbi:MAG: hypothetical protein ROD09_11750 [Candidatus Sedimenticola sp. (ex Thyasira tokunagai)]